ncbi:interleukin-17 receptor E [Chanos chanos]|uniref:Interleukin-17 receptor E n=1 Tax=Chanos chanos TaxID=29144 RepID=A0A6J2UPL5_CHACN|nr:interleukin-17 receptor E-like [Chanos chanos]
MSFALALLLSFIPVVLVQNSSIQRIQQCGSHCTQGLRCTSGPHMSFGKCRHMPALNTSSVFHNVTLATVMKCDIGVQDDCFSVKAGQDVYVTMKTVPRYCEAVWSQTYTVQDCTHEDLRHAITECLTGKLEYAVDFVRKELSVRVVDMPGGANYHLRLCYKDSICRGTGTHSLITQQDRGKSVTFQYSRLLPCLCIEGWPAWEDARRAQVCPFKNYTEEMWSGVTFDPHKEALSWEPKCPMLTVVTLCYKVGDHVCLDLGNTSITSDRETVIFAKVDPHPKLCMKFTTEHGSWIDCPFISGNFPVWEVKMASYGDEQKAEIVSSVRADFLLTLCRMTEPSEKMRSTEVNLSGSVCEPNMCIQVRRMDVQFSLPHLQCHFQCWMNEEVRLKEIFVPFRAFLVDRFCDDMKETGFSGPGETAESPGGPVTSDD